MYVHSRSDKLSYVDIQLQTHFKGEHIPCWPYGHNVGVLVEHLEQDRAVKLPYTETQRHTDTQTGRQAQCTVYERSPTDDIHDLCKCASIECALSVLRVCM